MRQSMRFMPTIILMLVLCSSLCMAQLSKTDTALYIYFQHRPHFKAIYFVYDYETHKKERMIKYWFNDFEGTFDSYELAFISILGKKSDTLLIKKLKAPKMVTPETLKSFIKTNYRHIGGAYFRRLKEIYMVEPTKKKGYVTVTKVELDIDIE